MGCNVERGFISYTNILNFKAGQIRVLKKAPNCISSLIVYIQQKNQSRQIYRGYSNFWNEYALYFIEWSEKCIFHEWRSHEWNIHFLASRDEINGIFIPKIWIFFLLYTILSVTYFFAVNDVIHVRTLHHINDDVHNVKWRPKLKP